jgi:hypothetical protein
MSRLEGTLDRIVVGTHCTVLHVYKSNPVSQNGKEPQDMPGLRHQELLRAEK